ncbi:MAG: SRPBCC family protein [Mycobacteriales bacterium]
MQRIDITQDFALPVERVYAYLAEHEHLGPLFGAKVTRVNDGDTSRNGAGSVRRLQVPPLPPFEETVTEAVEGERIAYRITKGSPLKDHRGVMDFSSTPTGSRLHYVIEFGAAVPGLDRVVKLGLERSIRKGLKTVDAKA